MVKEFEWDTYGENAQILFETNIPVYEGYAYFCSLKYAGIDQHISRLRIFDLDSELSYSLYGLFSLGDAENLASSLPPATEELDEVRCLVGYLDPRPNFLDDAPVTRPATKYLLRVEDQGNTKLALKTVFSVWGFGFYPCRPHEIEDAIFSGQHDVVRAITEYVLE